MLNRSERGDDGVKPRACAGDSRAAVGVPRQACGRVVKIPAGREITVYITSDPDAARALQPAAPVIGITGSEADYSVWTGVKYLAENAEELPEWYIRVAAERFLGCPSVIAEHVPEEEASGGWRVRESTVADLDGFMALYRDPDVQRFLPGAARGRSDWKRYLAACGERASNTDLPDIWTLESRDGIFYGRIGLEWTDDERFPGWYLGFALLPAFRGRGLCAAAARGLLPVLKERYGLEQIYLKCRPENAASRHCAGRLGMKPVWAEAEKLVFLLKLSGDL